MTIPEFLQSTFFSITAHAESPDAELLAERRDLAGDFQVFYDDIPAHFHADLVERSVDFIANFPGVEQAIHEDRELIYVWGRTVDLLALDQALNRWWHEQF